MAEHDLTARMGSFLDRHLVFPLLEFLSVKEVSFNLYRIFIDSLTFMVKLSGNSCIFFKVKTRRICIKQVYFLDDFKLTICSSHYFCLGS